jgi:hypothetical protein
MTDLVPFATDLQPTRTERQTARALERVHGRQAVMSAQEIARVEMIAQVTEAALLSVSHISALESLLVTRTPRAEERLRHLADAGTLGITQVVFNASRRCQ